jgi:hypothetical protein
VWRRNVFVIYGNFTRVLQILWAAISDFPEGVKLLMECGCDAVTALAWVKSFDLLQEIDIKPMRRASQREASVTDSSKQRRQVVLVSSSCIQAIQAQRLLHCCVEDGDRVVHEPMVAQLYTGEPFMLPQAADIKWTSRVLGISMQVISLELFAFNYAALLTLPPAWVVRLAIDSCSICHGRSYGNFCRS